LTDFVPELRCADRALTSISSSAIPVRWKPGAGIVVQQELTAFCNATAQRRCRPRLAVADANLDPDGGNGQMQSMPQRFGDKWTPIVLYCLLGGVRRFNELQHHIPDIFQKMLIQVLRKLEASGLANRKVYPVVPPKTEYTLTEAGQHLHEPAALLCQWAAANTALLDKIEASVVKSIEGLAFSDRIDPTRSPSETFFWNGPAYVGQRRRRS
jgi:DNA-binding HxlR family transcriptional regulator